MSSLNAGHAYATTADPAAHGEAVDAFLARCFPHSTREAWAARVVAGEVEVDGAVAGPGTRLRRGARVVWHRPPWVEPEVPRDWVVVHEDAELLVVDKPAGLPTLPSGGFLAHTLLALVRAQVPEAVPMHRLGTGTSGLVVFARTAAAASALQADWRGHRVEKVYRAVVSGVPSPAEQEITVPIGPVPHPGLGTVHAATASGRPAHSHLVVLAQAGADAVVEVRITTGRPHQIRVHAAAIGHPLVGDPLYLPGGLARPDAFPTDVGYRLHARRVGLHHPGTGAWTVVERAAAWEAELGLGPR